MDKLIIFDTTLRDGEQSPGASMNAEDKLRIALQLEVLGADIIEAGFPAASKGDFQAVSNIAKRIQNSTVCALSRALKNDIELAAKALSSAENKRIHTFIATSELHMKSKLKMTPEQVKEHVVSSVQLAKNYTNDVEFSAEDAGRSDFDFLCQIIELAIKHGATTINIPDTVGYTMPSEFGSLIEKLMHTVPNADRAVFSVHCHDDLGLSTANALSGILAGARQVECTINGLGERAGNSALEEIVMAIKTRPNIFKCETNICLKEIVPTSRLVSSISGFVVQPNKAIVGINAFAHASGIHQDGILKNRNTYEIMDPESLGWGKNQLVLSKHSGRNAFFSHMKSLNVSFKNQEKADQAFVDFKNLADQKTYVSDDNLKQMFSKESLEETPISAIELHQLTCNSQFLNQTTSQASCSIKLKINGTLRTSTAESFGVVDAIFQSIERLVQSKSTLTLYSVNSITEGSDSIGSVSVRLLKDQEIVQGHGAHNDILIASAYAYINALNKLFSKQDTDNSKLFEIHL